MTGGPSGPLPLNAHELALAYYRVSTGDQSPPRPWAYLSQMGITRVSDVAVLTVLGYTDGAAFQVTTEDGVFRVMVTRVDA